MPILCLRSISIENLPNVDPDRGTRILILVLMNNRIVFSTMQHAGRLSWIKTSGDPACFPVNCMVCVVPIKSMALVWETDRERWAGPRSRYRSRVSRS